jgi:ABC-type bacteriocin/lantibiotic exporter with double-glycine peptidase domain
MELLGSIVVLMCSVWVVCLNETLLLEPGVVGLLILWTSNFNITLNFMINTCAETKAAITAIERLDAMVDLPSEQPMETNQEHMPAESWPGHSLLKFVTKSHYGMETNYHCL